MRSLLLMLAVLYVASMGIVALEQAEEAHVAQAVRDTETLYLAWER